MENAESILVVILSIVLAISLILHIILLVICIKIAHHVRYIMAKAQSITDKAESVADFVQWAATPMAVGRFIASAVDIAFRRNKSGTKKQEE